MRHGADPTRAAHIGEDEEEYEIVLPEKETVELPTEPNPVQEPDVAPAPEPEKVPEPAVVPEGEPVPLEVPAWVTR